jgi:rod shape-determining protein MreC
MSWSHPDFRVSAMAGDGSAFGIVSPHLAGNTACVGVTGGCETADRYLLELRGVPFRGALKEGTLISSSGLGGVFPRGIPIGVVIGELETPEQWTRTYLLRPTIYPRDVTSVLILAPQLVGRDSLDAVWSSPERSASTVQRIVGSADSIRSIQVQDSVDRARPPLDSAAIRARMPFDSTTLR